MSSSIETQNFIRKIKRYVNQGDKLCDSDYKDKHIHNFREKNIDEEVICQYRYMTRWKNIRRLTLHLLRCDIRLHTTRNFMKLFYSFYERSLYFKNEYEKELVTRYDKYSDSNKKYLRMTISNITNYINKFLYERYFIIMSFQSKLSSNDLCRKIYEYVF